MFKKIPFLILVAGLAASGAWAAEILPDTPVRHNGRIKPFDAFARQTLKVLAEADKWDKKTAFPLIKEAVQNPKSAASWKWIRVDLKDLKRYLNLSDETHFFSYDDLLPVKSRVEFLVQNAKEKRKKDERPSKTEQKAETLYNQIRTFEELQSGGLYTVLPADDAAVNKSRLRVESFYLNYEPHTKAAALYFLACFIFLLFTDKKMHVFANLCILLAFLWHTVGLICRVYVLARPPVSNMYESMIFMSWVLVFFAGIFSFIYKNNIPLRVGALVGGLVMLYSRLLPIDASLDVLVPVLRSTYWLSVHVMTVVSSYGAFGLAMALGHRYLILDYMGKLPKKAAQESANLMDRVIQLGVILIGTGTVLGGVWANESWGRFWGWDPKETWALITFLCYLIVVHLRFLKKMNSFWLAFSAVLGFLVVLMTWYGVNFVLGRGLHSYGQGSGGMKWIIYYLIAEAAFIGFVLKARLLDRGFSG